MLEFVIYNTQTRWTIRASDGHWSYSIWSISYPKREIIRKLKQKAYDKFKVKRIKATIYD